MDKVFQKHVQVMQGGKYITTLTCLTYVVSLTENFEKLLKIEGKLRIRR